MADRHCTTTQTSVRASNHDHVFSNLDASITELEACKNARLS